ncbi:hypothetical protein ABJI51_02930 [Amycolatopsis sp. NEAU-NG30]|uniref:Transmembrane protein n=1 Tax=Amycolatopsis melonis TaxID=3156488 RepID=A0ABV0L6S6_9PSEU
MYTRMWLTRLRHSLLPGRGSVARPSDRVQAALPASVLLLSLAAAAGAVLPGIGIHTREAAESRDQTATRYTATATLLDDGPTATTGGRGTSPGEPGPARARWLTRNGQWRTGEVAAPAGTAAGNEIAIRLDASGTPAERPLTPAAVAVDAPVIAAGLWAGVVFVLALAYWAVVYLLDRFRLADWQREWAQLPAGRPRRD